MTAAQNGPHEGQRILERYELVRFVARGGMGSVWEARDHTLDQVVALKHVSFASLPPAEAEETRRRTLREARFAAQLRGHHHVVAIYDVFELDGDVWLVLEYLPSRSLADLTGEGRIFEAGEAARIGAAVATALAAAHERGITHRDVKPGNVLLGNEGAVKLTDFGISHAEGENPLTAVDVVSGTPAYMSREVARGEPETSASDVFSLGATLYKAVEGRPPFGEEPSSIKMLHRVAYGLIEPPRRAGPFGPLLMHLLELDPATRPDAASAARMLADYGERSRTPTRPPGGGAGWPPPGRTSGQGSGPPSGPHSGPPPGSYSGPPSGPHSGPPPGSCSGPHSGPHSGPPSAPSAPVERSRRRGLLVGGIAAAVVVVLALVAGGVYLGTRPSDDPNAPPALRTSVPAVTMTGAPRDADPCALLDPVRMGRYGVATIGQGSDIGQCRLTIDASTGARTFTEVHFSSSTLEQVRSLGPPQNLGGFSVSRVGFLDGECATYIQLPDSTLIAIGTRPGQTSSPANLCDITEGAVAVAVDRLATVGITYRPGWQPGALARQDACRLVGTGLAAVPGLSTGQQVGAPDGASCFIGSGVAGSPYVTVRLGLEPTGQMGAYGQAGTLGGLTTFTAPTQPYYNTASCQVSVARPRGPDAVGLTTEYVGVSVEGASPSDVLCAQAGAVGVAAVRNVAG